MRPRKLPDTCTRRDVTYTAVASLRTVSPVMIASSPGFQRWAPAVKTTTTAAAANPVQWKTAMPTPADRRCFGTAPTATLSPLIAWYSPITNV